MNGIPVEVCRFFLDEKGRLDVRLNNGIEATDAVKLFIACMREQMKNLPQLQQLAEASLEENRKAN